MNITSSAATAAKLFLEAQNITSVPNIYAELEDAADSTTAILRTVPCATCFGSDAVEFPPLSGNYRLNVHVVIEASFDDTDATAFASMCNAVLSVFHTSTIAADITAALSNFTCFSIAGAASQSPSVNSQERLRRHEFVLPIYACASDIPA